MRYNSPFHNVLETFPQPRFFIDERVGDGEGIDDSFEGIWAAIGLNK